MAPVSTSSRSRILANTAAIILLSGFTAACSTSSMTTGATGAAPAAYTGQPMPPALVGTNPISNGQQNMAQLPPTPGGTGPSPAVTTGALPPAAATAANQTYQGTPTTYSQPMAQPTQMAAAPAAATGGQGQTITVTSGQTLFSLSRQYGVSVAAIAAANGLTQTSGLQIGQTLFIPAPGSQQATGVPPTNLAVMTTNAAGQPVTAATPPATQAVATTTQPAQLPGSHVVRQGETLYSIATMYGISPTNLAAANNISNQSLVQVGQSLVIPGATRAPTQTATSAPVPAATQPVANPQLAAVNPTPTPAPTPAAPAAPAATTTPATANVAPATAAAAPSVNGTSFRWPARGPIISGFGTRPGGERNDGINLQLPQGSQILAAEAGTVIYAGNEIPGYGNLILIRHADNWVTAYAHASQMLVTKDQVVTRGQPIALVGATGSVSSPQLHFELRRGSTPVNPLDYLAE